MKLERKYKIKKDIKLDLTKCQGAFSMKREFVSYKKSE